MGHANLTNISTAFVNHLYAKGSLTIRQMTDYCIKKEIYLQASEGTYEDEFMIRQGIAEFLDFASSNRQIVPRLTVFEFKRFKIDPKRLTKDLKTLLNQCNVEKLDDELHFVTADKIEDEGYSDWAKHVRSIPEQRLLIHQFENSLIDEWDTEEYESFDSLVVWEFAYGWRRRYKEIELLHHISN